MKTKSATIAVMGMIVMCLLVSACGPAEMSYKIHHTLLDKKRQLPKRIIILPVDISVYQLSTGGVNEEIKRWSFAANKNVHDVISDYAKGTGKFALVNYPKLTQREKSIIEEHTALYGIVVKLGLRDFTRSWQHKRRYFDYTIGGGIGFLAKKTGADAALLVVGVDYVVANGNKAAGSGKQELGILPGESNLIVGIVDLKSGNLLWINKNHASNHSLRLKKDVRKMVDSLMQDYPGIQKYKQVLGIK